MCFKKAFMKCFHINKYNICNLVVLFIERLNTAVLKEDLESVVKCKSRQS